MKILKIKTNRSSNKLKDCRFSEENYFKWKRTLVNERETIRWSMEWKFKKFVKNILEMWYLLGEM